MPEPANVPDPLANFDQALRELADVARIMRCYYRALTGEGFDAKQALTLTVAYQSRFLDATFSKGSEPDDA